MQTLELPLGQLREASWNANRMNPAMLKKLKTSISRYDLVEPLVVRPLADGSYEVVSGNQRLSVVHELGFTHATCVVVNLDDAHARLLAQELNRIQGEEDLGLRAELIREVLKHLSREEILALLPETEGSLDALASLGQETIAQHLESWQKARESRFRHLTFQVTETQLHVVEGALAQIMPLAKVQRGDSPNTRGTALYLLCERYLKQGGPQ